MAEDIIEQPPDSVETDEASETSEISETSPRIGGAPKYCKKCYYQLKGLELIGVCPECGRVYNLSNYASYTYDDKPPPAWKRLARGWLKLATLVFLLVGGYFLLPHLAWGVIGFFPLWIGFSVYLMLDLMYRQVGSTVGFGAAVIGTGLGALICTTLYGPVLLLNLLGAMFGGFGGICLVQAEISNMRAS